MSVYLNIFYSYESKDPGQSIYIIINIIDNE